MTSKISSLNNIFGFYNFSGLGWTKFVFLKSLAHVVESYTEVAIYFISLVISILNQEPKKQANAVRVIGALEKFGKTGSKYTKSWTEVCSNKSEVLYMWGFTQMTIQMRIYSNLKVIWGSTYTSFRVFKVINLGKLGPNTLISLEMSVLVILESGTWVCFSWWVQWNILFK